MALVDELVQKITIKADTKALDVVQKKEEKLITTTNTLSDSFKSAFKWLIGGWLAKSIFNSTIQFDSMQRSFNTLAGSAEKGAEEIRFLRAEAERLGQSFPSIADAYKGLFATGLGANIDTRTIREVFSGVLEASAVLGTSEQETQSAIIALQQMLSKGRVMTQELRLQLGNALPGAFQIAAKAMGVSTKELEEMVSKGLDAKDFIKKFGDELHRQFGGQKLEGSIHSIRAEWVRLQNAIFDTKTGIFSGETGEALAELIKSITKALTSDTFRMALKGIAYALNLVMKNIKMIVFYLGVYKAMKILNSLNLLKVAMIAFNKELVISKSLSMALGSGFKASLKYLLTMNKASLLFAKNIAVAMGILLLSEDLLASLAPGSKTATKHYGKKLGEYMEPKKEDTIWDKIIKWNVEYNPITGPMMTMGKGIAGWKEFLSGKAFSPKQTETSDVIELSVPTQSPNITINQTIATDASPDDIAEKTKQTLTGLFTQYSLGGVK